MEVVSNFVTLHKREPITGLCPFRETWNLRSTCRREEYLCASRSEEHPIHFVMKHEQMTYYGALKYLAKKYHIEVVEKSLPTRRDELRATESMFILNEYARLFVKRCTSTPREKRWVSHFRERASETISSRNFGWATAWERAPFRLRPRKQATSGTTCQEGTPPVDNRIDRLSVFPGTGAFPVHTLSGKGWRLGRISKAENTVSTSAPEAIFRSQ